MQSSSAPFEVPDIYSHTTATVPANLHYSVSLVLQYWSVGSSSRIGLQETKQELLFHSNQDQLSSNLCMGVCVGDVSAPFWCRTVNR